MKSSFKQGQIREYWKSNIELDKWFDPSFSEFIDKEIVQKTTTSPKQN